MALRPGIAAAVAGGVLTVFAAAWGIGADPAARNPTFTVAPPGPGGAANLRLAPGLSFVDDSSSEFPIRGDGLEDGRIASDRPTVVFFGTSHCYNTNREAERLVAFYAKHRAEARFLVVDLKAPSSDQNALVAALYGGSIPTVAFLDREGHVVYDRSGETAGMRGDTGRLEELLRRAAAAPPGGD